MQPNENESTNRAVDWLLGEKIANSETRHRPAWFPPSDTDIRLLGERLAFLVIPPYKPPYMRHRRVKMWVDVGLLHRVAIVDVDLDERSIDLEVFDDD